MTPEEMLEKLGAEGDNAGADYDDGVEGWFGWSVTTVRNAATQQVIRHDLTVTLQRDGQPDVSHTWTLNPTR